jgi:hypothetical protein
MKIYRIFRKADNSAGAEVIEEVFDNPLDKNPEHVENIKSLKVKPLFHAIRHSPTGFNYGYLGSGCADLARSILLDMQYTEESVDDCYQAFKIRYISSVNIDQAEFTIPEDAIKVWWDMYYYSGGMEDDI